MPGPDDPNAIPSAAPALEVVTPAAAPASAPSPAPAAPEVVAQPAQPDQATAQPAPAAESSPAGAEPTHAPTLLDKFDEKEAAAEAAKAEPAKPAEVAKPEEGKPEEKPAADAKGPEAPATEPAPEPAPALAPIDYFAAETGIKLPEGLTLDDAGKQEVAAAFDAFRADPQKGMQGLVDLHQKFVSQAAERMVADMWTQFNKTNADWAALTMADPILGGAGHDTAMARVAKVRDAVGSNAPRGSEQWTKDIADLNMAMKITGAGNNPHILRAFHNMAPFIREARMPVTDGGVPKTNGAAPKNGRKLNYDNPTSQQT